MCQNIWVLCLLVLLVGVHGQYQPNQANKQPPPQGHQQQGHKGRLENFLEKKDIEHIKHDIKDQYHVDLDAKTGEQELDYYNFKLHDYDNNLLLDGLEILVALNHDSDHVPDKSESAPSKRSGREQQEQTQSKFDNDAAVIDQILKDYDTDQDGYISYYEYKQVRARYP